MSLLDKYKIELEKNKQISFKIKVHPGAKISEVKEILIDGTVKISLKAKPIDGAANQALIKFLAEEFSVSKNCVEIIKGEKGKNKIIRISSYKVIKL